MRTEPPPPAAETAPELITDASAGAVQVRAPGGPGAVVVGDGWAALAAYAFARARGREVAWVAGSGARIWAPLPHVDPAAHPDAVTGWRALAQLNDDSAARVEVEALPVLDGGRLREFRNRAFRALVSAADPAELEEEIRSRYWGPDRWAFPRMEVSLRRPLAEIEAESRARWLRDAFQRSARFEGAHVTGLLLREDGGAAGVRLESGQEVRADEVIFADRPSSVARVEGLPKPIGFLARREPAAWLQAVLCHKVAFSDRAGQGYAATLNREAGEEWDRQAWGCFLDGGKRSVWTTAITRDEAEDNHQIAKRLRKLKAALEKMFAAADAGGFGASIESEQVVFHEGIAFAAGEPPREAGTLGRGADGGGVRFLTDGYGPSLAVGLAWRLCGGSGPNPS